MVQAVSSTEKHMDWDELSEETIHQRLQAAYQAGVEPESPGLPLELLYPHGEPRPAAVLLPLLCQAGCWHLLFTRRNADLPEHSGQVSFPGGRSDPGDATPEQTALREAEEEIGLATRDVRLLGRLRDFLTITNYLVTPVVCAIPWPYPLRPAAHEVSRAFTIPLAWLADMTNRDTRLRPLPEPYAPLPVIYFREYDGELLWGASARFTVELIQVLSSGTG